jgi:hypothetical protein
VVPEVTMLGEMASVALPEPSELADRRHDELLRRFGVCLVMGFTA